MKAKVISEHTKVSAILDQAHSCLTQEDASQLRDCLAEAFRSDRQLSHLEYANQEAYIEAERGPFVRFELNRVVSSDYIIMIRPEIRHDAVAVVVITNRMLDGAGMASQRWDVVDDLEDVIEGDLQDTVATLAARASAKAIEHHAYLLESVGLSSATAQQAARDNWLG